MKNLHHSPKLNSSAKKSNREGKVDTTPVKKALILFGFILLAGFIWFLWTLLSATSGVAKFDFFQNPLQQTEDRINILLLGNGGANHEGSNLTDSIVVASYHLKTKEATLISIPRDLWLPDLKAKVNTAYEEGEERQEGGGLKFAKEQISSLLGMPIHYGVRIDFDGFSQAVNTVGGLDVEVPRTFDDYMYPIEGEEDNLCDYKEEERELSEEQIKALQIPSPVPAWLGSWGKDPLTPGKKKVLIDKEGKIATDEPEFTCRYEHIHFDKGIMHMDGETALKFVRSRHALGGEGSDFARSRRQQNVIQSFRTKVLSVETLSNPQKILGLANTLGSSLETDIPAERFPDFYKFAQELRKTQSIVLGDLGDGESLFINPSPSDYFGAWVLIPRDNNYGLINEFVKSSLEAQVASAEASLKK